MGLRWTEYSRKREKFDSEDGWQGEVVFGAGRRGLRSFLDLLFEGGRDEEAGHWRAVASTAGDGRNDLHPASRDPRPETRFVPILTHLLRSGGVDHRGYQCMYYSGLYNVSVNAPTGDYLSGKSLETLRCDLTLPWRGSIRRTHAITNSTMHWAVASRARLRPAAGLMLACLISKTALC